MRMDGLRRAGLGSSQPSGSAGQEEPDPTQNINIGSQETQPGFPASPQGEGATPAGPGPPAQESIPGARSGIIEQGEPRKHKETQTEQESRPPPSEGLAAGSHVEDSAWREGYEAARRIMRQFFHEIHQNRQDRGEAGWIWNHLSKEMLDKGKLEFRTGPSEGIQGPWEGERASGSTDRRLEGSSTTIHHRHHTEADQGPGGQYQAEEDSRKRPRPSEQEAPQEAVPMDVDQEGVVVTPPQDEHDTEQENLDYADQQQYSAAPTEGWNHEWGEPIHKEPKNRPEGEEKFCVRTEMLKLTVRIVEATGGSQGKHKREELGQLRELLARILETMEVGESSSNPFVGTVQGFDTEELIRNHKLRSSMFDVRPSYRNCIAQLRWEVSLWERFFPRIKSQRVDTALESRELGEGSSTRRKRTPHQ